jgi:hypothetical protein
MWQGHHRSWPTEVKGQALQGAEGSELLVGEVAGQAQVGGVHYRQRSIAVAHIPCMEDSAS